ncbi:MAG: 30S ribosomal protein S16 [Bacteroidia bacterium]|nr:30S ribosomal protein S16 [Bacteroidia bacterium]
MSTKIRLQRHGKKGSPYFHIVVADSRAKRDGKYIERIGSYNPNVNPALIELDNDKALDWLDKGAQPSDTARAILSYRGVMYRKHLMRGVRKGALTEEQAQEKYEAWLSEKTQKIADKTTKIQSDVQSARTKALEAESAVKEERAKKIMAKQSALAGEAAAAEEGATDAPTAEGDAPAEATAEASADAPAEQAEAPSAETPAAQAEADKPAEEPKAEAEKPAEQATEEKPAEAPTAQAEAEKPAEEPKAEEGGSDEGKPKDA